MLEIGFEKGRYVHQTNTYYLNQNDLFMFTV